MPSVKIVNQQNQPVGELTLADKVFGVKINRHLLWEAVQSQLANVRRGTVATKTRGEVSGGGIKPWKQKGTGRARAGSNRSPLWYHGGTTFGPQPRDYTWELPKKIRQQALRCAFSAKLADGEMVVLDQFQLAAAKTKEIAGIMKTLKLSGRTTFILDKLDDKIRLAGRNLQALRIINPQNLNTYDVLDCDHLLMTRDAATQIEEKLSK